MTAEQQWDKTVALWRKEGSFFEDLQYGIGVVTRRNRWTLEGDVLLVSLPNGDDRWAFTGVTSKGRHLVRYYQSMSRKKGGRIKHVELPGELAKLSPADPAVRRFVLERVRACSNSPCTGDVAACDGTQETGR